VLHVLGKNRIRKELGKPRNGSVCLQSFRNTELELYVEKIIGQLTKVRTSLRHENLSRWIAKTRHNKYRFAVSVH